jgi:hypothetical protein
MSSDRNFRSRKLGENVINYVRKISYFESNNNTTANSVRIKLTKVSIGCFYIYSLEA